MRCCVAMLLLLSAACAEDKMSRPPDRPQELTVWNSTQRPLEEVRVHDGAEYLDTPNRLDAPLPDDERAVVNILRGQRITVIRRNVDGGPRIAFTTATGLPITGPGFVLQVFQESFRLHEPEADGAPDGGDPVPDGGDAMADGGDTMTDGDGDTMPDGGDAGGD